VQRQRQAGPNSLGRRLGLELRPACLTAAIITRRVFDSHRMAVACGMQARTVVELVLHLVDPRGHRIAARHGHRQPMRLNGQATRQPAAEKPGGEQRKFVQELLDVIGAEQCGLQFLKIPGRVIFDLVCHSHTFSGRVYPHPFLDFCLSLPTLCP
jgi:hypothetical protein